MSLLFASRGLGATVGCSELDDALTRLQVALGAAGDLPATSDNPDPRYAAGQSFYDAHVTSILGSTIVAGQQCTNLVNECNARLADLNQMLQEAGQPIVPPSQGGQPTGNFWDGFLPNLGPWPWVIGGIALLAAAGYFLSGLSKVTRGRGPA